MFNKFDSLVRDDQRRVFLHLLVSQLTLKRCEFTKYLKGFKNGKKRKDLEKGCLKGI